MKKFLLSIMSGMMVASALASPSDISQNRHSRGVEGQESNIAEVRKTDPRVLNVLKKRRDRKNPFATEGMRPAVNHFQRATRAASDKYSFYGNLVYSNYDDYLGFYEITPGYGYELYLEDPGYENFGFDLMPYNGWYDNGKVSGVSLYWTDPYTIGLYFTYTLNFRTGRITAYEEYFNLDALEYMFDVCTMNPDDGQIYGYALKATGGNFTYYWATASPDNITKIKVIKEANYGDNFVSITYRPDEGMFYGITSGNFNFVRIDLQGNQEIIGTAPSYSNMTFWDLQSGLIWGDQDGVFYWNAQMYDYDKGDIVSYLYSITPDGKFDIVENYHGDQQFTFFFTNKQYVNTEAPAIPVIQNVDFEGGSLEGKMTVILPEKFNDNSALPAEIEYTALLNGVAYTTGKAAPGSEITVDYSVKDPGLYVLGIYVTSGGFNSKTAVETRYIGYDIPAQPQNVLLTTQGLTWDAVTMGENGGNIDLEKLVYLVTLNGEALEPVKTNSYPIDLLAKEGMEKYTATVTAVCGDLVGQTAVSNSIVAGKPLELPLSYAPTEEEFETMTVVNNNNDSYVYEDGEITWTLTEHGLFSSGTEYSSSTMDDYIFLPPVELTAGQNNYALMFLSGIYNQMFPDEYLNVVYAASPSPEDVKGLILENYTPKANLYDNKWEEWDNVEVRFGVPEDGAYYIGFQCVSKPQMWGIYIKDILLNSVDNTPEPVGNLEVVAGENGALTAEISFVMPEKTLDGSALTGTITAIVTVNDIETATLSGTPGSEQSIKVETVQGNNTISVVAYWGELQSGQATMTVYTGVSLPATPQNLALELDRNNMGGLLTWDAVTQSATPGGYVNPETITYTVMVYTAQNPRWEVWRSDITATSFQIKLDPMATQDQYAWGVIAGNAAGVNNEVEFVTTIMGQAYAVPFIETFSEGVITKSPWLNWPVNDINTTSLAVKSIKDLKPGYQGDDVIVLGGSNIYGIACTGLVSMPYFSTRGSSRLGFCMNYLTGPLTAGVRVYANIYGSDEDIFIGEIPENMGDVNEFRNFVFEMPEALLGQDWVQVYFEILFPGLPEVFALEGVEIGRDVTGVEALYDKLAKIYSGAGSIYVSGCEGEQLTISTLDGRVVFAGTAQEATVKYEVAPGIYVVRAGKSQSKLVVR